MLYSHSSIKNSKKLLKAQNHADITLITRYENLWPQRVRVLFSPIEYKCCRTNVIKNNQAFVLTSLYLFYLYSSFMLSLISTTLVQHKIFSQLLNERSRHCGQLWPSYDDGCLMAIGRSLTFASSITIYFLSLIQ